MVSKDLIQRRTAGEVLTTLTADGLSYVVNDPDGTPADGVITHQNKATALLALVSTTVGRAVLQAVDAAAQRLALGLGTAALTSYEAGTWTPVISGSTTAGVNTYSNQTGSFVKIGRFVHVGGRVALSALGTAGDAMAGNVQITGLPFAISQTAISSAALNWISGLTGQVAGDLYAWQIATGSALLLSRSRISAGSYGLASVPVTELTATTQFRFSAFYLAAS